MDPELSKAKVTRQVERLLKMKELVAFHQWKIEQAGLNVYVTMLAEGQPDRQFVVRLACDGYPERAWSVGFVDTDNRREGKEHWPQQGAAFNAALKRDPPQLCIPGVREFHESLHRDQPWDPSKYPLGAVLGSIQAELNTAYRQ